MGFFRPAGACAIAPFTTHGLRRGLHSFAPSELGVDIQDGNVTRVTAVSHLNHDNMPVKANSATRTATIGRCVCSGKRLGQQGQRSRWQETAAERRENAAHGLRRGVGTGKGKAPGGAKDLSHTSGNILLHFIFSTQGRRPFIKPEFRDDLFAYLGGIVREMQGTALIINGTADHVHVLVRIRPAQSAAEIARVVKANSSRWVHEKWSSEFGWQTGYGVFSVSESNVAEVTKYIAGQEDHHQKHSFQEEFVSFLKKNNIVYDEKYIWD